MKRFIYLLFALVLIWLVIRFVFGGSEDDWICVDGQWIKHGNPSSLMPEAICE